MIGENRQPGIQYEQNDQTINPETYYTRSASTTNASRTTPTEQKYATANSTSMSGNGNKTTDKNINPALAGA